MIAHEYNAEQALGVLMKMLRRWDDGLAAHIQMAIDAGKDITETEPSPDGRRKPRPYRKTVPFSREEALQVALDALQAFFIEQPLFVNSAADNLARAVLGVPETDSPKWLFGAAVSASDPEPLLLEGKDRDKLLEIELQTETQLDKRGEETMPLKRRSQAEITRQQIQMTELRQLLGFSND